MPPGAIVVAGMHRSGTSLVAQLVNAFGVYAGRPEELGAADIFNPTGYWEYRDAVDLNRELLQGQVPDAAARAARVARSLQGRGPFVLKDPRISLLFPLWREALGDPVCVIAWRDPVAVARSLAHRDGRPLLASFAGWEHYNRTLLRDTEGVPRVLVSYEQLLADPVGVARDLYDALTRFGIEGLTPPTEESVRQIVFAAFNRSGLETRPSDAALLDDDQRALLESLRSGAALQEPVAPTSPRTVELLAELDQLERTQQAMHAQLHDRDLLLASVFDSQSWRVGHRATGLLRLLRRVRNVSAEERWRALRSQ
jgi:hypothetical protein